MKKYFFILILSLTMQSSVLVAQTDSKRDKLTKFVKLFKPEQTIKNHKDNCYKSLEKYSLDYMYQKNPSSFAHITPGSKYWTEVVKIFDEYQSVRCTYLKIDEAINYYIDTYDKLLTEEELDKILEFYQSPIGHKLLDAEYEAAINIQNFYREKSLEAYDKSLENYQKKLEDLRKKAYYGE